MCRPQGNTFSNFWFSQGYTLSHFWTSHGLAKGITFDNVGLGNYTTAPQHLQLMKETMTFEISESKPNSEICANSNGLEMNLTKNISI